MGLMPTIIGPLIYAYILSKLSDLVKGTPPSPIEEYGRKCLLAFRLLLASSGSVSLFNMAGLRFFASLLNVVTYLLFFIDYILLMIGLSR